MPGEFKKSEDYIKLLYLKGLYQHAADPFFALASRSAILENGREVTLAGAGTILPQASVDSFKRLKDKAMATVAPKTKSENQLLKIEVDGKQYTFNDRIVDDVKVFFANENQLFEKFIANITFWDLLVINAVLTEARSPIFAIEFEESQRLAESEESLLSWKKRNEQFWLELKKLALDCYILPTVECIKKQNNNEQASQLTDIPEFRSAANLLSVCETQISAGRVPEAFQPLVYELVDQTTQYLMGKGDSEKFLNVVSDLMPLQHTVGGIVVGAALIFAGLALATFSIMLAIQSFGISTPLSLLGIKVAVSMMVAGVAIGSAVVGVTAASVVTGGFFAGKFKVPTEFAEQSPEGATEISNASQGFAKYHEEKDKKTPSKRESLMSDDYSENDGLISPDASL